MVDANFLSGNHALSVHDQPHLESLYHALAKDKTRVTFVIGAGLAMDSGLPSWSTLINRMSGQIAKTNVPGLDLASMVRQDSDDLMRKAEHVINMCLTTSGFGTPAELVRRALYERYPKTEPGPLAQALVRLAETLPGRVSFMTTNFDDVLDVGCADAKIPARIYTLEEFEAWSADSSSTASEPGIPILHLHGRLERGSAAKGNLVLTESDFLTHGPGVKNAVKSVLSEATTVFIGLSVTDPNLVGPLWENQKVKSARSFSLSVPGSRRANLTTEHERAYAIYKSAYLEDKLGLKPLFFKSYSQLEQMLNECRVAAQDIKSYLSSDPARSIAYGHRFDKLLVLAYSRVGLLNDGTRTNFDKARALSDELSSFLDSKAALGKLLAKYMKDAGVNKRLHSLKNKWAKDAVEGSTERFSLWLWLRNPVADDQPPYSLRLAASSGQTFGISSLMPMQAVEIEPRTPIPAALALMRGKGQFWNLESLHGLGVWKGSVASRVRAREHVAGQEVNSSIGAVTLQSNFTYVGSTQTEEGLPDVSLLSALDTSQRRALLFEMEEAARTLF